MIAFWAIFILGVIGAGEAGYLIRKRIIASHPVCPMGGNCEAVLTSKYSKLVLIPNDVAGLLFYIVISLTAIILIFNLGPIHALKQILKILVGVGSLVSWILTFIQWRVVKEWCFWCLMSAFTIWIIGAVVLISRQFS